MSGPLVDVSIQVKQSDIDAIHAAMDRMTDELGYSIPHALNAAVVSIVNSLSASTGISPKNRDYEEVVSKSLGKGRRTFKVTGWFGKPRVFGTKRVKAHNVSELKEHGAGIRRRGLAKASWKWCKRALRSAMSPVDEASSSMVSSSTAAIAARSVSSESRLTCADPFIKVTNKLDYIEKALEGGAQDIDTAMERAAAGMMHSIDKQLERLADRL